MNAANYGQFGSTEDNEHQPSSPLERALLCRRLGWQMLPWEMDAISTADVKVPLTLLNVYDVFAKYGVKIDSLSESEAQMVGSIERLRTLLNE